MLIDTLNLLIESCAHLWHFDAMKPKTANCSPTSNASSWSQGQEMAAQHREADRGQPIVGNVVSISGDYLDIDALIGSPSSASRQTVDSLAGLPRWVNWRDESGVKVPYHPKGYRASSTKPDQWSTRDKLRDGGHGFMLGDGYGGLDLDSIRDPATGQLEPAAAEVVRRFDTYTEVSPSGKGVKLFFRYRPEDAAALSNQARNTFSCGAHREMAVDWSKRYYTVTEQRLDGSPKELRTVDLATLTWFVCEAGPAFKGAGHANSRDRSDEAWAIACDLKRVGGSFEQFLVKLAEDPVLAEWATDKRQVQRAWDRNEVTPWTEQFDDLEEELGAPPPPTKLKFVSPSECEDSASRIYVVKGLLSQGDVGCIYGAPGAGKSLISPHIGYQVALGSRAFGMRTKQGGVLYVAPEDPHGLKGRITALRMQYGDTANFHLVEGVSNLLEQGSPDLEAIRIAVAERRPVLIFLDTLAAAFPGLEENSAEGMSLVVSVARSLTVHGAAVVLIHHDTKQQTPTPRGHSGLNGALDVALQLFPRDTDGIIRGKLSKNRNGPCDLDIAFRIGLVDRGVDEDGDPIRLPHVVELSGTPPRREKLPARAQFALSHLSELKRESATVTEVEWREACVEGRKVSPAEEREARVKAFKRAKSDLIRAGIVDVRNGHVFTRAELEPDPFDEVTPQDSAGRQ
jgi:hypothetical protein